MKGVIENILLGALNTDINIDKSDERKMNPVTGMELLIITSKLLDVERGLTLGSDFMSEASNLPPPPPFLDKDKNGYHRIYRNLKFFGIFIMVLLVSNISIASYNLYIDANVKTDMSPSLEREVGCEVKFVPKLKSDLVVDLTTPSNTLVTLEPTLAIGVPWHKGSVKWVKRTRSPHHSGHN